MFGWKQPQADLPEVAADESMTPEISTPEILVTPDSDAKPTEAVVVKPVEWQTPTFRHVDRPDCAETFADSITGVFFDGQTLRIELSVSRMDETKPGAPLTGHRTPVCRLVVPPSTALDLVQKMQQVGAALAKAGYVRSAAPPAKAG
jgi:hypothetical protein